MFGVRNIHNATAIVTGSTRGIGAEIAKRLGSVGANVVVCGRSAKDGENIVEEIESGKGEATFVQTDVREPADLKNLINTTVDKFEGIDILVNNAGFETDTAPHEVTIDTWTAIIETDFRAYWLTAKYAYPYLTESEYASIVNVSSNHSFMTQPKKFPYNAVKAGIDSMTRSMALSWGVDGIRVNSVNPGWTMVDRIENSLSDEELQYLERIHPLGRIGSPEDIADAVLFLASNQAGFITGESLVIDGGRTAVLQDDLYLHDHDISVDE